jgi:hypothetical protein
MRSWAGRRRSGRSDQDEAPDGRDAMLGDVPCDAMEREIPNISRTFAAAIIDTGPLVAFFDRAEPYYADPRARISGACHGFE